MRPRLGESLAGAAGRIVFPTARSAAVAAALKTNGRFGCYKNSTTSVPGGWPEQVSDRKSRRPP
jgi:hypothetical protein